MGNVRTEQIKRMAKELVKRFPGKFTLDFENNKQAVRSLVLGGTPKVLNQIAGCITRAIATEKRQMEESVQEENEVERAETSQEEAEAA